MAPEKLRTAAEDAEACPPPATLHVVEFSRGRWNSKRARWKTGLLFVVAIAVTAAVSAGIGITVGLGIAGTSPSTCSDSTTDTSDGGEEATNAVNQPEVEVHLQSSVAGCPVHPYPSSLPSPLPDKIGSVISGIESRLASLVDDETMPGLVASITYRDRDVWSKGFGVIKKGDPELPPDKDTLFRIASVSKIFVVLMVYQMYDHGLVASLDDPLNAFCPNFHINNPFSSLPENITLRQVMTSMSGLPREAPCGQPENPELNLCPLNTATILERLSQQSTILPSWTQPSYSNLGFALLGRCLVSHFFPDSSYEDYIQENILRPLGMSSTGFNYSLVSVKENLATGYESDGSEEPLYDVGWWGPAGQMYSSASDLNKLAKFLYSNGGADDDDEVYSSVLSPSLRRLVLLPTYTNRELETGIGTPWEVSYQQDYTLLMKGGNLRGYSAVFSLVPELKLGLNILFSGAASNKLSLVSELHSLLIPAFVETLTPTHLVYPLPPNTTQYTGFYTAKWSSGQAALANIFTSRGSLALSGSAFRGIYLAYREPSRFQVEFAEDEVSCLSAQLLALRHTWLYFDTQPPSAPHWQAQSFTMPGFSPGLHFTRI